MKKWILIGIAAIVVITAALLVFLASNLGPMIKTAVNTYGPQITKTDLSLGDVSISIFSAEARIKEFLLGNPKGFQSPHAMKVGSVHVNVNEKSITSNTIIVDKIEVVAPDISYEKIKGTDNFRSILNNVNQAVGAEKSAKKKAGSDEKKPGKKIIISDFIVKDGKVNLTMALLGGKTISAPLPDIHLKDIGKDKGGASPAEAFSEIFNSLYAKITSPAVTDSLNQGLKALGTSVDAMGKSVSREVEKITKGLPIEKEADKTVKDITGKVKGLLGN